MLLVRLFWRQINPPPPPEATPLGRLLEIAAKLSHFTLYGLLFAVPFLGMIVQLKRGHALPVFGIWQFRRRGRSIAISPEAFSGLHDWLADALLILAGIHAGAALVHHWIGATARCRACCPARC